MVGQQALALSVGVRILLSQFLSPSDGGKSVKRRYIGIAKNEIEAGVMEDTS